MSLLSSNASLSDAHKVLTSIPGIGDIIAFELLAMMPELGEIDRGKIASLAGVAPRANDSGKRFGYRKTGPGRDGVRAMLFTAAMAAIRAKGTLRDFYEHLIGKGKKKMVALTAVMRKLIVIANAKMKEFKGKILAI